MAEHVTTVAALETGFQVLEYLQEHQKAGVTEIAESIDRSPSTVYNHLTTLKQLGYVIKVDGKYAPAARLLKFGEAAKHRNRAYTLADPKVEKIADETKERAQFVVEEQGYGVYVHCATGSRAVWTDSGLGKRVPLHATSAGKAILAFLPRDRVEGILDDVGQPKITENTITDRSTLLKELDEIRDAGYAFNHAENTEGLRAVGVPITVEDEVLGALTVSGPSHRFRGEQFRTELPNHLMGIANELELNIRYARNPTGSNHPP